MSLLGTMIAGFLADGELPAPMGTAYKALLPYQTFRTKTRDLALAVGSEKLWQIFCPAIGRPELANDPRYRRNGNRAKNRATLIPLLQEVLSFAKNHVGFSTRPRSFHGSEGANCSEMHCWGYRYLQIIGLRAVARSGGTPRRERGREGGLWRGFGGKPSELDYAARLT